MSNSGIQMSGGRLNAKQIAVGHGAKVILREGSSETALYDALVRLESSIAASQLPEDKVKELIKMTASVKEEASKEQPDKSKVERALQLIKESAGSISAVVAAAKLVMTLLL